MPDGRLSLPADLRIKHGLSQRGDVIVEDAGDTIILRTSARSSPAPRPSAAN
jgi:bifunctional DNA-binding transcriptional regulator/antitoxin component of YhaV-PrlF toxin-antitoxin module